MVNLMRVLMVGSSCPPETFLARLFQGLTSAGIEVTVACSRRPQADWLVHPCFRWLPTSAWSESLPQRLLHLSAQTGGALIRDPASAVRRLRRSFQVAGRSGVTDWNRFAPFVGRRWDVIYFPWSSGAISYLPLFEWGMPVVVSCREAQANVAPHTPEYLTIREGLRATLERAAAVHCVSAAIREEAIYYGLDPAKATVIRPAVDPDFFVPPANDRLPSSEVRVVTTGSLIWRKGYEYALQAIRLLLDRNVPAQFAIIGDGPERQRLYYTIRDLGLQEHVHLLGQLPPTQVRHHLQQADAFLLTSLSGGISNAILEAMSCGLAVVTTDCVGMREVLTDGVEGFIVPLREPQATVQAIEQLARHPQLRSKMGAAGRQRVIQDFQLKEQVAQFVELFEKVAL